MSSPRRLIVLCPTSAAVLIGANGRVHTELAETDVDAVMVANTPSWRAAMIEFALHDPDTLAMIEARWAEQMRRAIAPLEAR